MFKASMGYIAQETKQNTKYPTVKETVWLVTHPTSGSSILHCIILQTLLIFDKEKV